MNTRRAWLVYGVGTFAYLVAITQRTSIGVAGVVATHRFHSTAATLSTLAVVQLIVYAAAQVPVGVLLDRFGPRRLMLAGTLIMAAGQLVVAFSPTIGLAVAGRVLVGAGDATIFISLIRLTTSWFRGPSVPQLSQWVGNIGQLGQVISAVPFAWLLHEQGWTPAFLTLAAFAGLGFVGVLIAVADRPADSLEQPRRADWATSMRLLGESLRRPGTQLGFWSHFTTQSSGTVFSLLWGLPFLHFALGYPATEASALLIVQVIAGMAVGPVLGLLTARYPLRRSTLVLGILLLMAAAWALLLLWPGTPPFAVVIVVLVAIGIGGPGAVIGLDFARSFNPLHSLGSANGIVNVGGFSASFIMMFAIGVILDAAHRDFGQPMYSLASFRVAFLVQYLVVGAGAVMLLRARLRTRADYNDGEGITVAPVWVALNARLGRRGR